MGLEPFILKSWGKLADLHTQENEQWIESFYLATYLLI